jgi:tetratricopeptide (TPR) repeat protein
MKLLILFVLSTTLLVKCSPGGSHDGPTEAIPLFDGIGTHSRTVATSSDRAQKYVDQGFAFLYAFNHDEAIRSFEQATKSDSTCAMAWWGIAYANGPHINLPTMLPHQVTAAWQALQRAQRHAVHESEVNKALINALASRYSESPPADRTPLDSAYARSMRNVWMTYAKDADVCALTAEALMDLSPWNQWQPDGKPTSGTEEILTILASTLTLDPDHPLALHLTIHALEASTTPERAVPAADRLRELTPALGHLVHMPSHIDVRTGSWEQAIIANRKAMEADRLYQKRSPRQGFYRIYMAHNYHMKALACMMTGRSAEAIEALDDMVAAIPDSFRMQWADAIDGFFAMPLEARVRFGKWDEILDAPELDSTLPVSRAMRHYARGVAFAATKRTTEARAEMDAFEREASRVPIAGTFGNNMSTSIINIARHVLAGEVLFREGHIDKGLAELRTAVQLEDALRYDEPPSWIIPTRHTLGASLIVARKFDEAEAVYRADLRKLPNNGWSLYGLSRVLAILGKTEESVTYEQQFQKVWKDADLRITSSCLCLAD